MYARLTSMCCGLLDWMPRYIPPGPLAVNKRVADRLFLRTYNLELEQAKDYCILAHRKAALTVGPAQQLDCPSRYQVLKPNVYVCGRDASSLLVGE